MPDPRQITSGRLKLAGLVAAIIAGLVVAVGLVTRVQADHRLQAWAKDQAVPTVGLARISGSGARDLVLPGDIQALSTAAIHARVPGYLKRWNVDIGTQVKAGQLLAEIDTPDLDQQVLQARADLATAQANQGLAATTAKRWAGLVAQDAVSRQEADEKAGDLVAKSSLVNAQRANLNRLLALESFKRITAPFDGVVTSRSTDVGALINVSGAADQALFTVADQRRLRVYVHVPQSYSALIHPGVAADVTVPELPGQTFQATVATDARAVGAQTGAVLTELALDNAAGKLRSGAYAQVTFKLASAPDAIKLPATALLYRNSVPMVAIVGPDGHVTLRKVTIARDFGNSVEIGSGVKHGDRIADNPPEAIADGDPVRIAGVAREKGAGRGPG